MSSLAYFFLVSQVSVKARGFRLGEGMKTFLEMFWLGCFVFSCFLVFRRGAREPFCARRAASTARVLLWDFCSRVRAPRLGVIVLREQLRLPGFWVRIFRVCVVFGDCLCPLRELTGQFPCGWLVFLSKKVLQNPSRTLTVCFVTCDVGFDFCLVLCFICEGYLSAF